MNLDDVVGAQYIAHLPIKGGERPKNLISGFPDSWSNSLITSKYGTVMGVGAQFPRRSIGELIQAVNMGLGLSITLDEKLDLTCLAPVLSKIEYLAIQGSGGSVENWDALRDAQNLRWLQTRIAPRGLDVSNSERLERFVGVGAESLPAAFAPNLRSLEIETSFWPDSVEIVGALEKLTITKSRNVVKLPPLRFPSALRELHISGSQKFHLGSLINLSSVEWVTFYPCREIENLKALSQLPFLREIQFEGLRAIDSLQDIQEIPASRIIIGNHTIIHDSLRNELIKDSRFVIDKAKRASN